MLMWLMNLGFAGGGAAATVDIKMVVVNSFSQPVMVKSAAQDIAVKSIAPNMKVLSRAQAIFVTSKPMSEDAE